MQSSSSFRLVFTQAALIFQVPRHFNVAYEHSVGAVLLQLVIGEHSSQLQVEALTS